jgi:uncharacterized protein YwlG (UPF0340 family)
LFFSEEVVGVADAVDVDGGDLVSVEVDDDDATIYHVTVTGEDLAVITVTVDAAGITDGPINFNGLVMAAGVDGVGDYVVGDHVAPTIVTVVPNVDDVDNTPQMFTVDVTFSEAVQNTEAGILVNGNPATFTNVGNVYTIEISGADDDVITLEITDDITDVSINENPLANPNSWVFTVGDNTPPTVEVYKPAAMDTINQFDVTITFSEEVVGADATTITVSGVMPVDPTMELRTILAGRVYEATLWGLDGDSITLAFSGDIEDLAGNALVPATFLYTIGDVPPTVMADPDSGENLEDGAHEVTLTFSEDVVGVETGGVIVTGATSYTIEMVKDSVYKVTFTGAEETTVEITVSEDVKDWGGNSVTPATYTYTIDDNTAPEIVSVVPDSDASTTNTFVVNVQFSEPVWGTADGITVEGGTGFDITSGSDGDAFYQLTITGDDGDNIVINITADDISDGAGIPNTLVAGGSYYYTVGDNTGPTLQVTTLPDPQENTFDVLLTFNEGVVGVGQPGKISIDGAELTNVNGSSGDKVYILTFTAEDNAEVIIQLSSAITDLAGNAFAGATITLHVGDWTAPTATSMTPMGELDEDDTTFDLVLTLSEDVVAGSGMLTVMDANGEFVSFDVSEVTIDGNTVSVPVSLDRNTEYYVIVDEGFVTDAAGNPFAGIDDAAVWSFTTKEFATPAIIIENIQFKVYPNPFNDYINIENADKLSRVVVSNILGQSMIDVVNPEQVIRTPDLVSGVYVVTMFTEDGRVATERIVKR